MGGNGTDLRTNGCPGMHNQGNQNIHVAFNGVAEGSVARRDDDLKQIGSDSEVCRNSQKINHRGHADITSAPAKKAAEETAHESDEENYPE